jgi:hypothetical protein
MIRGSWSLGATLCYWSKATPGLITRHANGFGNSGFVDPSTVTPRGRAAGKSCIRFEVLSG